MGLFQSPPAEYVAQILAYEDDILRLLRDLQLYVATGQVNYVAVMRCRFSGRGIAIEEDASIAEPERRVDALSAYNNDATSHQSQANSRGNLTLTLTLLHVDTTWRLDHYESRLASPKLSWPAILQFYNASSCVGVDLILRRQFFYSSSEAPRNPNPPSHVLHIEISYSAESNAAIGEVTEKLRHGLQFWTQQLLFELDPATSSLTKGTVSYVVIQEFDTRHTAETLAASLNGKLLRSLTDKRIIKASTRICSLEGSATYHNATPPRVPNELVIQNRTHAEMTGEKGPGESYFGLSPKAYINL